MYTASFDIGSKHFAYCIASTPTDVRTLRLVDLSSKKKGVVGGGVYDRLLDVLNEEDWTHVDRVLIEQQNNRNVVAIKIAHSVWTWFRTKYPNIKDVRYVSARTKCSDAPTYTIRKKKTVDETYRLLSTSRPDLIAYIDSLKKKDDVCDAYIQFVVVVFTQSNRVPASTP